MQLKPEVEPASRPASFDLMRGVAAVVMAWAFFAWALASAAKVPCQCDESLTVRGAAMPWLSVGVLLVSVATLLLLHTEHQAPFPRAAIVAGCAGIVTAYGAFLTRSFGFAGQLMLAAGSALIFTVGVAAMVWRGASKRMAVFFGVALGSSVVIVAAAIMGRTSS